MKRSKYRQLHPLLLIAVYIVIFLEIHPIQDDDGHLGRVHLDFASVLLPNGMRWFSETA